MASTLGNPSLKLTADASNANRGLDAFQKQVAAFSRDVNKTLKEMRDDSNKPWFTVPFLGTKVSMKGMRGFALAEAKSFADWFAKGLQEAAKDIQATWKTALRTGLSSDVVAGVNFLGRLRDVDPEGMAEGWRHYSMTIGQALTGNQQAVDIFRRMGIEMEQIRGQTPDQVFMRVAQAIESMDDPFRRALALNDLLGRRGQELAKILRQGPDAIRAAVAEAQRLGLALGDVRTEQVNRGLRSWHEAMVRIESIARGFFNLVMSELGPVIDAISAKLKEWVTGWSANSDAVGAFTRSAITGVAQFVDAMRAAVAWIIQVALPAIVNAVQGRGGLMSAMSGIANAMVSALGNNTAGVMNAFNQAMNTGSAESDAFRERMRKLAEQLRALGSTEQFVQGIFAQADIERRNAQWAEAEAGRPIRQAPVASLPVEQIAETTRALQEQIRLWGLTADEQARARLAEQGATPASLNEITALQEQLRLLRERQRLFEQAQRATEEAVVNTERLDSEITRLINARRQGLIDEDALTNRVGDAFRRLTSAEHEQRLPDLALQGSRQEAEILVKARTAQESPQERIRRIVEQTLEQERANNEFNRQILDAIRNNRAGLGLRVEII